MEIVEGKEEKRNPIGARINRGKVGLFRWIELAASNDTTRLHLNHVYTYRDCLVASDGHRIHLVKQSALAEFRGIKVQEKQVATVEAGKIQLTSPKNEDNVPDFSMVLPNARRIDSSHYYPVKLKAESCELEVLAKLSRAAGDSYGGAPVKIKVSKNRRNLLLTLRNTRWTHGKFGASWTIPIEADDSELPAGYEIGINPSYLEMALRETTEVRFPHHAVCPILFLGTDTQAVVMPCRL